LHLLGGFGLGMWVNYFRLKASRWNKVALGLITLFVAMGLRADYPKFRRFFVNDGVGDLSVKLILDRADMYGAESLVKRRPTAENYLTLCWRYEQNWRYKDSIAACENALKLRPDFAAAYDQLAVAQVDLEDWDGAIAAAQRALELDPTLPRAKFNLERSQRELARRAEPPPAIAP
jgi:tetratricopeptide (TPR) repeat protein